MWGNLRKKSPLGRPIVSGDTLKINSKEIRWDVTDWINLASIICREYIARTLLHAVVWFIKYVALRYIEKDR